MLRSAQREAAEALCKQYADCTSMKLTHDENVECVLRPIMQNYARRLLFSVGKTIDESVEEVLEELLAKYR